MGLLAVVIPRARGASQKSHSHLTSARVSISIVTIDVDNHSAERDVIFSEHRVFDKDDRLETLE